MRSIDKYFIEISSEFLIINEIFKNEVAIDRESPPMGLASGYYPGAIGKVIG